MKKNKLSKSIYSDLSFYGIKLEDVKSDENNYYIEDIDSVNQAINEYAKDYFRNLILEKKPLGIAIPNISSNRYLNYFRSEKLNNNSWIVTNDIGQWICLSKDDYLQVTTKNIETYSKELEHLLYNNLFIIDINNIEKYTEQLKKMYSFLDSGPGLHIIVVTRKCNLSCIYCQVTEGLESESSMTVETADKIIENVLKSNSEYITVEFQGGEPTLNFDIVEYIVLEIKKRNTDKVIDFSFISNFSTSFNKKITKFIIDNDIYLSVSLDGPENIHNYNRDPKNNKSFQNAIKNIELIRQLDKTNGIRLNAMPVITKKSIPYFKEIIDLYLKLGFNQVFLKYLTPLGRSRKSSEFDYSSDEYLESWKKAIEYIIDQRLTGVKVNEFHLDIILQKIFNLPSDYVDMRTPCGASFGQVTYYSDGSLYTCDEGRMFEDDSFKIGEADDSLLLALKSKNAKLVTMSSLNDLYYCDMCAFKPYCGVCPAINYSVNGSYFMNILESKKCKIHKEMFRYIFDKYTTAEKYSLVFSEMVEEYSV